MNNLNSKTLNTLLIIVFTTFFIACDEDLGCDLSGCPSPLECVDGECVDLTDCNAGGNCQNGGTCDNGTCDCPEGFSGDNCEIVDDPCDIIICENGGTCVDGTCDCENGFEGDNCESGYNEKFIGTYSFTDDCVSSAYIEVSTIVITGESSDVFSIFIENIGGIDAWDVNATITNSNEFSFSDELMYDGNTVTVEGLGTINESTVTINYNTSGDYTISNCTIVATK